MGEFEVKLCNQSGIDSSGRVGQKPIKQPAWSTTKCFECRISHFTTAEFDATENLPSPSAFVSADVKVPTREVLTKLNDTILSQRDQASRKRLIYFQQLWIYILCTYTVIPTSGINWYWNWCDSDTLLDLGYDSSSEHDLSDVDLDWARAWLQSRHSTSTFIWTLIIPYIQF